MSTTTMAVTEVSRLVSSLNVLLPRLDAITAEFCRLLTYAAPDVRRLLPSDERLIAVGIEDILQAIESPEQAGQVMARYVQLAEVAGVNATHLPVLVASIQTSLAETAGYTWTEPLEDAWTMWFDHLMTVAVQGPTLPDQHAA